MLPFNATKERNIVVDIAVHEAGFEPATLLTLWLCLTSRARVPSYTIHVTKVGLLFILRPHRSAALSVLSPSRAMCNAYLFFLLSYQSDN